MIQVTSFESFKQSRSHVPAALKADVAVPTLIIGGDQDDNCLEGSMFLKRVLPCAGLHMFPMSGHLVNLEEPELFNRSLQDFLSTVELGRWIKP